MKNKQFDMGKRDHRIVCGLYLSKFDQKGLNHLGFSSFTEAFNALGYGLGAPPASIKNYRDEMDPLFPNPRKGWWNRPLRDHCRRILDSYGEYEMRPLAELIRSFLFPQPVYAGFQDIENILRTAQSEGSTPFAKRLITGKAAERYFVRHYNRMHDFSNRDLELTDMTERGCGFDFMLKDKDGHWVGVVEVKGMQGKRGAFQLTELEHHVAKELRNRFFLVLVRNFAETPFPTVINDPLGSDLHFVKTERNEVRITWAANVD